MIKKCKYSLILANHWSFTGIGWQLGIESCRDSINDSLNLADKNPSVKVCINLDARAYQAVRKYYPETADRLSKYLKDNKTEIVGGTYGQPMGSTIGNESVIRQIIEGRKAVKESVGFEMKSFLEEEEFTFPQLPQILKKSGFDYASIAQCDTWGKVGVPVINEPRILWKAKDGSEILAITKSPLYFHPPAVTKDVDALLEVDYREKLIQMCNFDKYPLVNVWTEFGWEPSTEHNINIFYHEKYSKISEFDNVKYVTISEYLESCKDSNDKSVYISYDEFNKLLPWGVGADQLRRFDRLAENKLLTAERLNVMSVINGKRDYSAEITEAWKNLLISQSHDVSLCEYSRWGGGVIPASERAEEYYGLKWGSIGYYYLNNAISDADNITQKIIKELESQKPKVSFDYEKSFAVFNASQRIESGEYRTGRIYLGENVKNIVIKDENGNPQKFGIVNSFKRENDSLYYVDLKVSCDNILPFATKTYYVCKAIKAGNSRSLVSKTEDGFIVENEKLKAVIDRKSGYLTSLICKETGEDVSVGNTFRFHGEPSHEYPLWNKNIDLPYLSSSDGAVSVKILTDTENCAVILSEFRHPQFIYQIKYQLDLSADGLNAVCRLKINVPPKAAEGKINGWQLPLEIKDGYYIDLDCALSEPKYYVDAPFEVVQTEKSAFFATHFVNVSGKKTSLQIMHGGNQYFKKTEKGLSNLVMREWESHFTSEVDWLHFSEFKYCLVPHKSDMSYAEMLEISDKSIFKPYICQTSGIDVDSILNVDGGTVSSFRKTDKGIELRIYNPSDISVETSVKVGFNYLKAYETDFLGNEKKELFRNAERIKKTLSPWEIFTVLLVI